MYLGCSKTVDKTVKCWDISYTKNHPFVHGSILWNHPSKNVPTNLNHQMASGTILHRAQLPRQWLAANSLDSKLASNCPQASQEWYCAIYWVVPLPSNSHHVGFLHLFSRGSHKPSFATVAGKGTTQAI